MQPGRALLGLLATLIPLSIVLDFVKSLSLFTTRFELALLNHNSSTRFKQITRMTKPVFRRLLRLLE